MRPSSPGRPRHLRPLPIPLFPVTAHGVVFVQTDNPAGNAIVVYNRGADGSLHPSGTYATGGNGGVLTGSVVDHLASQGSLVYDRPSHASLRRQRGQ